MRPAARALWETGAEEMRVGAAPAPGARRRAPVRRSPDRRAMGGRSGPGASRVHGPQPRQQFGHHALKLPALVVAAQAQHQTRVETIQLPYSLIDRQHEASLVACRKRHAMGLLSYNSLAHGFLTGKHSATSRFEGTDLRARNGSIRDVALRAALSGPHLSAVGARYGRSPAQIAIRWTVQQIPGIVVLAGMKRLVQVEENAAAFGWQLAAEDAAVLDSVTGGWCC